MKKVSAGTNKHIILVSWKCGNRGQQYVTIKSVDLNKSVRISRNYSTDENRQIEHLLNLLGLDFIGYSGRGKQDIFMFEWDYETLEKNFAKKNFESLPHDLTTLK